MCQKEGERGAKDAAKFIDGAMQLQARPGHTTWLWALSAQLLPARNLEVGDLHRAANFRVSRSNSSALPQNMGVLLYYLFPSAGFKELGKFSG